MNQIPPRLALDVVTSEPLGARYSQRRRALYMASAVALGVVIAGFWNFRVVDGFGSDIVARYAIGGYRARPGNSRAWAPGSDSFSRWSPGWLPPSLPVTVWPSR